MQPLNQLREPTYAHIKKLKKNSGKWFREEEQIEEEVKIKDTRPTDIKVTLIL
jgi:hypothetical protein